jgi:HK97 family phage major capsid protein
VAFEELNQYRSIEELTSHLDSLRSERKQLDSEFTGLPFPDEVAEKFATLTETITEGERRMTELQARSRIIEEGASDPAKTERAFDEVMRSMPRTSMRERDIYDLTSLRSLPSEEAVSRELHDRAMRAAELATYSHTDRAEAQEKATRLLEKDTEDGLIARRYLMTGSPTFQRAWFKSIAGRPLNAEETNAISAVRALSLTGSAGGFAVPFELDPTVIPTSNGAVNPLRAVSRVIPIAGDEWRGISSGAITTAYAAEATETTDNSPTLAQPTISTEKAQAFIPFSIEIGMDWGTLRTEMGNLLQDSKDELEATKFTTGTGTNEPFGVVTGATNTVNATAAGAFDVEDLYRLTSSLPARYRARAAYMASLDVFNRIRQFDTAGGASLWTTLGGDVPQQLLGKPIYENSAMATVTTVGALFLIIGDFSRFVIVDRIGLSIELIPHLFGTNHRPTGSRGLYAFWRNGAKVVDANAFRVLIGLA